MEMPMQRWQISLKNIFNSIQKLLKMENHNAMTAEFIHRKFKLPKIVSKKIEEAHQSVNVPQTLLNKLLFQHSHKQKITVGQKKSKKKHFFSQIKVNSIEENDINLEEELTKKYKPKNGSHSHLKDEQNQDEKRINNIFYGKLKRPNFGSNSNSRSKFESSKSQDKITQKQIQKLYEPTNKTSYTKKLAKIRDKSSFMTYKSRDLQKKVQEMLESNDLSYQKLKQASKALIAGQQIVKKDEEEIKRTLMQK